MKVLIYLLIPAILLIIFFLSRDTEPPGNLKETGISGIFLRMSFYIYRKIRKEHHFPGESRIRGYLSTLNGHQVKESIEAEYYSNKISIMLMMALTGSILSLALYVSDMGDFGITDNNQIKREGYGEGEQSFNLSAKGEEGENYGEFEIVVGEQMYTRDQADALFDKACTELEKVILKDNPSLNEVTSDLDLVNRLEGYPFQISWRLDNYEVCDYKGHIDQIKIPDEGLLLTLTAEYKYDGGKWQQVIYANIVKRELTPEEELRKGLTALLADKEEESRYEEIFTLPESYGGTKITWSEKREDNSLILLLLILTGGAATFVLKDNELKEKIDKRNHELFLDYPQFVSQLTLYLGAGMTVRNIFLKLSENYRKKKNLGGQERFLCEEIDRTAQELSLGKSEAKAYEDFGYRCSLQEYIRLCTLLSQNLRKGNSELLRQLKDESRNAFEKRLGDVRKMGEEAGTKLLLPMILMLLIVMLVIMIPAYMTF